MEIGSLILMSVYHGVLYFQVRRDYYMYMALICLMVLIRALLVYNGSRFLYQIFPVLDGDRLMEGIQPGWGMKLEYMVVYATLFLVPMFIHSLFNFRIHNKYIRWFQWAGGILLAFVLFTPYNIYHHTLNIYHVLMLLAFILVFIILFQAIKRKRTASNYILIGLIICFVFVFLEMFRNSGIYSFETNGPNLVNTGVVAYLFFQSLALSAIFAKSFHENQKLTEELEEKVAARTEQLSKSNVVKERFISVVSHDLRSPLSNLKGMLDLTQSGDLKPEDVKQLTGSISSNLDASLKLLDELLEWTGANTNISRVNMSREALVVNQLIDECAHLFKDHAARKGIRLNIEKHDPIQIESDKNALKVVFRNLISNAIKFTPVGGEVNVRLTDGLDWLMVQVTDSGIGVPDTMKRTLFEMERKNQRAGTANEKSSGIGLALCRDLVEQNGGKIWVEDNPKGQGATFKCSFPKLRQAQSA
jgi:signal transduction histidine kinase